MFGIRRATLLGTVGSALLMLGASTASAQEASSFYFHKLASGEYGPMDPDGVENGGPGTEQPAVTAIEVDGDVYLVVMWMQTYDEPNNNNVYWQGACSSVKLAKDGSPPEIVVDGKKISDVNAERPWNHPALSSYGQYALLAWGDNAANGNTRTYVMGYDHMCNAMTDKVRVSNNNNNNDGGPNISLIGEVEGKPWFFVDYESDGGGDSQTMALAVSYDTTNQTLKREWITGVVNPCDIARQTHAVHNMNYTLHCAPQGDNRPAEDGVVCAYIDNMTGDIMWKQNIAPSDPGNKIYNTQPDVVHMGGNNFVVQFSRSNGAGKNTNTKGSTENLAIILKNVGPDGMQQTSPIDLNPGGYAFHSKVCAGEWGPEGKQYLALMDSSPTGLGQATMSFVGYDPILQKLDVDPNRTWIPNPENSDGGYLQNIYGANPNNQGRGFQRCLGNVKNPAYGIDGGFKADAKTLFVWPHTVRESGNNKLSLYLGLIDGIVAVEKTPAPPTDDPGEVAVANPQTEPQDPTEDDPTVPGSPNGPTFDGASAGGCTVANVNTDDNDMSGLLALGLGAALAVARRRREEV